MPRASGPKTGLLRKGMEMVRETSSWITQRVNRSRPAPPYSSGMSSIQNPRALAFS